MNFTDYIKRLILGFLTIFALIVISITVVRQIFSPSEYFELKDIFIYMLGAFVGDLPSLILYSTKEIPEKEIRIRIIIHFVVLEVVLLIFGNVMGLVTGIKSTVVFAVQIGIIYALVRLLKWKDDSKSAYRINEKLKQLKDEQGDGLKEG